MPLPRTAGHFVFVRPVEFDEQTTSPSRTAQLSGASPDFPIPNPLSGRLLKAVFSVHFQEFQALQALAGSYSPNALAGNYTLLLSARPRTSRCEPVHPQLPCRTPSSVQTRCHVQPCRLRPENSFSGLATARPVYVWALRRASLPYHRNRGSTPTADFSDAQAPPYRVQQIRSSHRMMSPVVTSNQCSGCA